MRQLMLATIALLIGALPSLAQGHMGTPQEQQACTRGRPAILPQAVGRRQRGPAGNAAAKNRTRLSKSCQQGVSEPRY